MKIKNFLIIAILLFGLTRCGEEENLHSNNGKINFRDDQKISDVIVNYNEIIGYDTTKHVFRIDKSAWQRIDDKKFTELSAPFFGIGVALDDEIIYDAKYIPGMISASYDDIITFTLVTPDLVYLNLGYPGFNPELFTGTDLRNDPRLINQLKEDNKLIEIKD